MNHSTGRAERPPRFGNRLATPIGGTAQKSIYLVYSTFLVSAMAWFIRNGGSPIMAFTSSSGDMVWFPIVDKC
ncbi:unnamed protein product [Acanthoscelides obtectus]|uniref:Uncharacterized protein n=1 Tax=Acanthoscelides obtectus TaxID=200917 RepID=A0A9P0Q9T4_ACAOB|nr:unnamed protein product [Acanthoscelides obtectus]CAK1628312.1 hypothetical protein AOBTE_LOCUS5128 [Acanthoscelides obtectus]